jgi:hypothetical protein
LRLIAGQQDALGFALLIALVLAFAIVTVNLVRGWDRRSAFQGTLLGLLVLLGAFSWATAWWLTHQAANDPRSGLTGTATNDDVHLLVEMLTEISYQTRFERYDLPLLVAVESPTLRWYLRQFNAVQFGATVPPGTTTTALITRVEAPPPPIEDYASLELGLSNVGVERNDLAPAAPASETLRWWFFRESPDTVVQERITLWVRQDALPWSR